MITAGDLITTNYCGQWPQVWRVVDVRHDCQCGRYSAWPSSLVRGRQRLPHLHIVALDDREEPNWWNGFVQDAQGRLRSTGRMWHRAGDDRFEWIHPEILLVEKAAQGSLF